MAIDYETETRTTTTTGRRIFSGLNVDRQQTTEYRRPNFSRISFDEVEAVDSETSYNSTPEQISIDSPKQMDMLTVEKTIEQRPITPVKVRLNARGKIIVSVLSICICALIAFMIGNIVTINGLNNQIAAQQQIVLNQQQQVSDLKDEYDNLNNSLEQEAQNSGYTSIDSVQVTEVGGVEIIEKPTADIQGNWFDNLCNWLSNIFS